ncbi:pro-Pol polyprotein [Caerostris darwini]|uniref:Pro-Pol polyprotein n=1 Tax=Caerostris darwini TaxID=1538125 RepID=A0AAV4QZJ6_9ARAC|nr:pro-Pol polyprotein [Caerostris darwini]
MVLKPIFHKNKGKLRKATSSFERLNLNFKGPLPTNSRYHYLQTIVDEYSRFPFAYLCRDISSTTIVIRHQSVFSLLGIQGLNHRNSASECDSINYPILE